MVRFILAVALVLVLGVIILKVFGYAVPILDYPLGPLGGPMIQPRIEIQPPGYDLNLP